MRRDNGLVWNEELGWFKDIDEELEEIGIW